MATHDERRGPETYPADKARQGEIILRTPARRLIFIAGLVGAVAIAVIATLLLQR